MKKIYKYFFERLQIALLIPALFENLNISTIKTKKIVTLQLEK